MQAGRHTDRQILWSSQSSLQHYMHLAEDISWVPLLHVHRKLPTQHCTDRLGVAEIIIGLYRIGEK